MKGKNMMAIEPDRIKMILVIGVIVCAVLTGVLQLIQVFVDRRIEKK